MFDFPSDYLLFKKGSDLGEYFTIDELSKFDDATSVRYFDSFNGNIKSVN